MHDLPQARLRRKVRQYITAVPVTLVLIGFAIYSCRELGASKPIMLISVGLPALMLALYLTGIILGMRRLDRYEKDDGSAE